MVFVALGANQHAHYHGQELTPEHTFLRVFDFFAKNKIKVLKVSGLWESPAWPDPLAQPAYKNAVVQVETMLSPLDLLAFLKRTEEEFGRKPTVRNAPRPLDLDILDYQDRVLDTQILTLPHPRMCERGFVLFPLQEITPNWIDPIKNRAILDWIARLPLSDVEPLKRIHWPT